jgi:hypothetical protein
MLSCRLDDEEEVWNQKHTVKSTFPMFLIPFFFFDFPDFPPLFSFLFGWSGKNAPVGNL